MPSLLITHHELVLAAFQAGDILLTDEAGRPIMERPEVLMAPSVPRPVLAQIFDGTTWHHASLLDAKDLCAQEYVNLLASAATVAGPASPYFRFARF